MSSISQLNSSITEGLNETAQKDYKTYLKHYSLRNLEPMNFDEFVKNYANKS
ncbi:hypothetical protein [Lutibacter sp.]|mgnify:CR=1 FL=1|uniref:hypothetical protein n=1 Tax=Lutibacter sp. TaxID=1925666 RepID=UPI00349FD35D